MRNTRKILVALLVLMTLMVGMFAVTASAAAGETWTVAGSQTLCGSNWSTTDTKNDMTYDAATDSYVKVYTNVKAGTYEFKCAKNHAWTTAYPGSNYLLKVAKDGSTVTITLKGTAVTAKVEAPSCNHKYEITGGTVTCLTAGTRIWTCSVCNDSYTENLAALGHRYGEDGKCTACSATTKVVKVYLDNAAKWANVYCYAWATDPYVAWPGEKMQQGADGLYYYVVPTNCPNIIFNNGEGTQTADLKTPVDRNVIYNNSTKVWSAPAQDPDHQHVFADATCTLPKKCECGEIEGEALGHSFNADGVCTVCQYNPTYIIAGDVMKDEAENYKQGTNFLGTIWDGSNISNKLGYNTETGLFEKSYSNVAAGEYHAKIVHDGSWYGDGENNHYIAVANAGSVVTITFDPKTNTIGHSVHTHVWSDATCTEPQKCDCGATQGEAAGHQYFYPCDPVCMVCYELTNEDAKHNVTHVDAVPATCQANGNVEYWGCSDCGSCWLDEALTMVTNRMSIVTFADHVCVLDICMVCYLPQPSLVVGENTMVVPESGSKFGMVYIAEAGTYKVTASEGALTACIFTDSIYAEGSDFSIAEDGTLGASWSNYAVYAELEAGYYYIAVYGEGEHTVTLASYEPPVEDEVKNTVVLGDNHYVITDALLATGYEWFGLELQPGTYVVKGGLNLTIFVFNENPDCTLSGTENFKSNMDQFTFDFVEEFEFEIATAGVYWVGFRYDYAGDTREFDFNISLKPAHEHNFVEGKCECGEEDPDYQPPVEDDEKDPEPKPEPQPELTLVQKIMKTITELLAKITAWFKGFIGGLKK